MTSEPLPPEGDPETWDQVAARVTEEVAQVVNLTYATTLVNSMQAYMTVGFSHDQAFQLTQEEHRSRMSLMVSRALMMAAEQDDTPEP